MSQDTVVAKRYARALFEVAVEEKKTLEVEEELKALVSALASNTDLQRFISTPKISGEDKLAVLKQALEGKLSMVVINTLKLLVERGRMNILSDLLDSYVKIEGKSLSLADATVYSTYELDEREKKAVAEEFGTLSGRKIRVTNIIDKSLLGGLKVVIGDTLYDGSLAGKLERLEKSFNDKHRR
ncbi:F-type H+-transporting ATPase subunit delta [Paenibacillus forsythiae]|uniref:ATP synthase subunit delta n=1 Tax=Paenibacillus forsythiae TaxID=365616 RepID=A0ABU3HB53_9BACL|nr:F0F1 ATP synthase subunit delta [Paenibacillus forsythiae]MDT3428049.1 F-type H+-transporting ATPase subunit delta [Paenibacillus forsythiae]